MIPIYLASLKGHTDIVKILASKVNDPNAPRNNGLTPIQAAIRNGHAEVVKYLLSNVTEPNPPTPTGGRESFRICKTNRELKYGRISLFYNLIFYLLCNLIFNIIS